MSGIYGFDAFSPKEIAARVESMGVAGLALLVYLSRHADMNGGAIAREYVAVAAAKVSMPFWTAPFKGMLCSVLVGLVYHVIYLRAPDKG